MYKRDSQNVPECRRAISIELEEEFIRMKYSKEAYFCKVTREFVKVFDKTGLAERIERTMNFKKLIGTKSR
jgi:hypothetical protein